MKFIDPRGKIHLKPKDKEVKKRTSAYGMAFENNKILLIKTTWNDFWELPGGGQDPGEKILETIKREVLEETGHLAEEVDTTPIKSIKENFYANDIDVYFDSEMKFFLIKKIKNKNLEIDKKEVRDIQWIDVSNLNKENCKSLHLEVIKKVLEES